MMMMPAALPYGLRQIRCEEIPVPEPEPGKVLVRSRLASICGSDLHVVYMGWNAREFPLPHGHPGHEGAGEVVDGGGTEFSPGDVVLTVPSFWKSKAFAGYQLLDPEYLLRLPDSVPLAHLLMAQQLGTVVYSCKRLRSLSGQTVVVLGQGSVGLFHDFMLRRIGAHRIIAVEPVRERLAAARAMGVDEAIDVTGARATQAVLDLTGGQGADLVIDAVGSEGTLNQALSLGRPLGKIVVFGLPPGMDRVPFDWDTFFRRRLTMQSVYGAQDEPGLAAFRLAVDYIVRGDIDVAPFVTHQLPVWKVQEAFDLADSKGDGALKVSLTF